MVTNCGEGMDYLAFGKILNGLCQCGAWGCFDEFNRIDISVLSVISTQLQTIRSALLLRVKKFIVSSHLNYYYNIAPYLKIINKEILLLHHGALPLIVANTMSSVVYATKESLKSMPLL